jgi:F-type H+-transporting ATPase subunit gamma
MSDSTASLRRKISSAGDLQSVVRSMKAMAAANIGQYENSVKALAEYYRTVELGLGACFRRRDVIDLLPERNVTRGEPGIGAVVFGSDQGLVGQFNDVVADFAVKTLATLPGKPQVWAVGERVHARLADAGLQPRGLFTVPGSIQAITPLVGQIQIESEAHRAKGDYSQVYLFHNRPKSASSYEPVSQRLLPLDAQWQQGLAKVPWPTKTFPEIMGTGNQTLRSYANIYSFLCSAHAPNLWQARMPAGSPPWSEPIKISMSCFRISTRNSIVCAKAASTRNFSTWLPASRL